MKIINKLCLTVLILGGIGCLVFGGLMHISGQNVDVSDYLSVKIGEGRFGINFGQNGTGVGFFPAKQLNLSERQVMSDEIQTMIFDIGAAQLFIEPGEEFSIVADHAGVTENSVLDTIWYVDAGEEGFSSGNGSITVTVPTDKRVNLELDVGAGTVEIGDIMVGDFTVSIGAGSGTAGMLDMNGTFDIEVGVGSFAASATQPEDITIDAGLGSVILKLAASQECYDITADCGMGHVDAGSIHIDGTGDQEYTAPKAEGAISIDCGMGNVTVSFEN